MQIFLAPELTSELFYRNPGVISRGPESTCERTPDTVMSPDFLLLILRWDLLFLDERTHSLCSPIPMLNMSAKLLPKNLDAILITHTNVLSENQLPGTLNDVHQSK